MSSCVVVVVAFDGIVVVWTWSTLNDCACPIHNKRHVELSLVGRRWSMDGSLVCVCHVLFFLASCCYFNLIWVSESDATTDAYGRLLIYILKISADMVRESVDQNATRTSLCCPTSGTALGETNSF